MVIRGVWTNVVVPAKDAGADPQSPDPAHTLVGCEGWPGADERVVSSHRGDTATEIGRSWVGKGG